MTVKELIEALSQYPEEAQVVREEKIGVERSFYQYTPINADQVTYDKSDNEVIIYS